MCVCVFVAVKNDPFYDFDSSLLSPFLNDELGHSNMKCWPNQSAGNQQSMCFPPNKRRRKVSWQSQERRKKGANNIKEEEKSLAADQEWKKKQKKILVSIFHSYVPQRLPRFFFSQFHPSKFFPFIFLFLFCSRVLSDPRRLCVQLCVMEYQCESEDSLSLLSISLSCVCVFVLFFLLEWFQLFYLGLVVQLPFFPPLGLVNLF